MRSQNSSTKALHDQAIGIDRKYDHWMGGQFCVNCGASRRLGLACPYCQTAYEVMEQGEIRHAIRFTVQRSRRAYVPPARHWASRSHDPNLPPMGMRLRLKANVDVSRLARPARVIAVALKRYGLIVADNGSNWYLNGAPDPRWNDDDLGTIRDLHGRDFEVVRMDGLVSD